MSNNDEDAWSKSIQGQPSGTVKHRMSNMLIALNH